MHRSMAVDVPAPLPQRRILLALAELHHCTNVQLCRRWYKPGCIASIWRHVAALERAGLVAHDPRLLSRCDDGRTQRIYHLTPRGWRAVEAMGATPTVKTAAAGNRKYLYQEHTLAVVDLHCALREFAREDDRLEVVEAIPDAALKRDPLVVTEHGKTTKLVPDSWLHLHWGGADHRFWVEIDRGTEEEAAVRGKVAGILRAGTGRAQEKWGGKGFRAVYIVDPADPRTMVRRARTVLAWMEKELDRRREWGPFFLLAGVDPGSVSGRALCTAPYFVSPFARAPRPLLATPVAV